jgi:radical SAM protein with 4Fe4S-binding SPASM domain
MGNQSSILESPKANPVLQIERRHRAGEEVFFVLDPEKPAWATLNRHGLHVLERCDGSRTVNQISTEIAADFGISHEEARNVTEAFLKRMGETQLMDAEASANQKGLPRRNRFHNLAIEITRRCNLKCRHCFLDAGKADPHELNLVEIKEVIGQAKAAGGTSISLGGGEPLLRNDWEEIVQFALSQDLLVAIGSNGTLINHSLSRTLSRLPIKIQISLDGATPTGHDQIRRSGSFEAAMGGIRSLIAAGKLNDLVIAFTPMGPNIDELPAFFDLMIELGITIVQFPSLTRSGRAQKEWLALSLSDHQRLWLWQYLSERRAELKGQMDIISDCFSINIHNPGIPYRCSIGNQLRMDPRGDLYPCQCFHFGDDFLLGNIREISLTQIVKGTRLKDIINYCMDRPNRIVGCSQCRWRNFCGAGCMGNAYEATGSALMPDRCNVRKRWIEGLFEGRAGIPAKSKENPNQSDHDWQIHADFQVADKV